MNQPQPFNFHRNRYQKGSFIKTKHFETVEQYKLRLSFWPENEQPLKPIQKLPYYKPETIDLQFQDLFTA